MKKIRMLGLFLFALIFGIVGVRAEEVKTIQERIDNSTDSVTIKLDENYTGNIVVGKDKNVTLDLNGFTVTGNVSVTGGTLVVEDSTNNGKIVSKNNIPVANGNFTLNSGTIETTNYGIYGSDNSLVTINGGTIKTKSACLGSNNTTGDATFVVNGGTLTSDWQTVYLANPVGLTINGGTFNGGLAVRMGKININGGTINATVVDASKYDDIKDYYNLRNGYAWTSDAIHVMANTYTTNSSYGNGLELNITGGTINVENGLGSAVVIYDIGYVEQTVKVNISKNAVLKTNATNRKAYDVLSLSDIGVTNPASGYGKYSGNVKTNITGGTFSSDVTKYLTDEYEQDSKTGKVSAVVKEALVNVEIGEDSYLSVEDEEKVQNVLIDTLEKTKEVAVDNVNVEVGLTFENKSISNIPEKMLDVVEKISKDTKILKYFDLSVLVFDTDNQLALGNLTKLTDKVEFTIDLPADLPNVKKGFERKYYIVREHNGEYDMLTTTISKDGKKISFKTDKFSEYVLAYTDVEKNVKSPKTYDAIVKYLIINLLSVSLIVFSVKYLKKRFN